MGQIYDFHMTLNEHLVASHLGQLHQLLWLTRNSTVTVSTTGHPNNVQCPMAFCHFPQLPAAGWLYQMYNSISQSSLCMAPPLVPSLKASPYIVRRLIHLSCGTIPLSWRLLALLYWAVYHHYAIPGVRSSRFTVPIHSFGEPYRMELCLPMSSMVLCPMGMDMVNILDNGDRVMEVEDLTKRCKLKLH